MSLSGRVFLDRTDAGRTLVPVVRAAVDRDAVVLGVTRGGVMVAEEVALGLELPLDVLVVRKLGLPRHPELAFGALGEGGVEIVDHDLAARVGLTAEEVDLVRHRERIRLDDEVTRLRAGRPRRELAGHTAVVVDDGVATGATARAALAVARARAAHRVVLAVPTGPVGLAARLSASADLVLCALSTTPFTAVGQAYVDFHEVGEEDVVAALERAARREGGDAG